ncbi:MAG: sortase [Thermoflexaceae bacterium]|nr:sortase [Thermoflexaceae bacterium]
MTNGARSRSFPLSTLVAALMVIGAGAITWHGFSAGASGVSDSEASIPPVTMPAAVAAPFSSAAKAGALPGGLPTRIVAPTAGIDYAISEVGVVMEDGRPAWETAWRSVGHHLDSARPGQPGNMVLTGHVSVADQSSVATFKTLSRLKPGDVVEVYSGSQVYRYSITRVAVVPPAETRLLRSDHASRITLITCTKDLKQRLVVQGTLV